MGTDIILNNIRKCRFEKNEMTQQELADAAGCTRQTIVALEAGRYTPSLGLAFRIAGIFDKGLEDIFEYREP
ncbi:MAG: helix-turn-helix transcriptional regulator [FCB group bacterium]|nr:helix-turn-helix transcriptional regulator [FCB group bacterium]MBL7027640.1 helix-turn-helix transcriptional regulator [Candidatus Neomarinimicrobiota bacterium]MBL7121113.1 helix-turn-helix transcriptional regulator [Candidatus Neomarinimicrobiota bacterium]